MRRSPSESAQSQDEQFAQDLAWKLLDDRLDEEEAEQLSTLLLHSEAARRAYVQIVQMHVGLLDHFGALPSGADRMKKLQGHKHANAASASIAPIGETNGT